MTLADLAHRTPARIQSLDDGEHALSLMQLGLVPGTQVEVIRQAPLGDPLEVDVTGARLALRRAVAASVRVEVLSAPSPIGGPVEGAAESSKAEGSNQ